MKLIQLQYFLTIAACKSITKAAEQLYVSQPAVTKQMKLLEEELGVKLMKRTPSGVELTEVGMEFAKDIKNTLDELDKAVSKAVNAGNKNPEELRIGCFDGAVTEDFLPKLYAGLKASMPNLQIKLRRHNVRENRKALEEDHIDILIELRLPAGDEFFAEKDYCRRTLVKREGALIYSKNSPLAKKKKLALSDFAKETFFTVGGESSLTAPGLKTLKLLGLDDPVVEEVDNFASLMSNVQLGLGYAALAARAADTHPDLKAFPLPEEAGIEVVAVWKKKNTFVTKLMDKIID